MVRVEISETSLADLKQFVTEKGGKLIDGKCLQWQPLCFSWFMSKRSYFAADVPVITAVTTPVAPIVPRGVEMVEDSEDEHIGDGPAINHSVPTTASTSSTEATASRKEIAKHITSLLSDKGVPQRLFAGKVLNRSQGSFSDYLSKAPRGDT